MGSLVSAARAIAYYRATGNRMDSDVVFFKGVSSESGPALNKVVGRSWDRWRQGVGWGTEFLQISCAGWGRSFDIAAPLTRITVYRFGARPQNPEEGTLCESRYQRGFHGGNSMGASRTYRRDFRECLDAKDP